MNFRCQPVSLDFFDSAPVRLSQQTDLEASPAKIFAVFEDGGSWPQWFQGIRNVTWTSRDPKGVGTTRTVVLEAITVHEVFLAWDPGRRFAFRFEGHSLPMFRAFGEDYRLDPIAGGTRFTYAIAYELRLALRPFAPLVRRRFETMCRDASAGLARYMSGVASSGSKSGSAPIRLR